MQTATGPEGTTVQIEKWLHPEEHPEPVPLGGWGSMGASVPDAAAAIPETSLPSQGDGSRPVTVDTPAAKRVIL